MTAEQPSARLSVPAMSSRISRTNQSTAWSSVLADPVLMLLQAVASASSVLWSVARISVMDSSINVAFKRPAIVASLDFDRDPAVQPSGIGVW